MSGSWARAPLDFGATTAPSNVPERLRADVRRAVFAKHTGAEVADRAPPDEGLEQADLDTVQTDILAQLLSSALFYLAEDSDLQAIVRMRPEDSMPSTLAECNALLLLGAPAHIIHEHKATHGVAVRPAAPRRAPPRRAPPRARQPPPRPGSPLTPPRPPALGAIHAAAPPRPQYTTEMQPGDVLTRRGKALKDWTIRVPEAASPRAAAPLTRRHPAPPPPGLFSPPAPSY